MPERFWSLKSCPLFEQLSDDEIRQLEQQCRAKAFLRGSLIDLPGHSAATIYLVVSGRVKIAHITEDGKESILAFMQPGEVFGELAVVDEAGNEDFLEAVEKSTVLMIPVAAVRSLMERHPGISLAITKLIGLRRKRIERRLKSLMFHPARERLIHVLLDFAEDYGVMRGSELYLRIRLTHQELANLIGSTRETVTVALGELREEGYVRLERRRIVLAHPQLLAQTVHRSAPVVQGPLERVIPSYSPI
ncbi:MAG: Crp/Fnr family transcriptional regulator [Planctomycetaceae bacterium]